MSESGGEEEVPGEGGVKVRVVGEGHLPPLPIEEVILEKKLTFEEASKCLNTLGKDESGVRYAYLMLTATDRKLTDISIILNFKHLLFVDLSGNYLDMDTLQVLSEMPYVIYIKAQRNRSESAGLNTMPYLQVLSLARNLITETCDINQPMLQCLDLNYNNIYTAQFDVERVEALKQLELRGNQMFDVSGVFPPNLENLYLAQNKISRFAAVDMEKLTNLKVLHLRDNQIRKLNGFSAALVCLKYLNLRENKITKVRQFRKLQCLPALETLIILQNPVSGEIGGKLGGMEEEEIEGEGQPGDKTRVPLLVLLPNLKRINKTPVTLYEKEEAFETHDEKYEQIMQQDSSEDETEPPTTTEFTTDYTSEAEGIDLETDEEGDSKE